MGERLLVCYPGSGTCCGTDFAAFYYFFLLNLFFDLSNHSQNTICKPWLPIIASLSSNRDHGATLRLEGGGTVSDLILGGTRHFFLLTLYNSKNNGGHVPPPRPPLLRGPCPTFYIQVPSSFDCTH